MEAGTGCGCGVARTTSESFRTSPSAPPPTPTRDYVFGSRWVQAGARPYHVGGGVLATRCAGNEDDDDEDGDSIDYGDLFEDDDEEGDSSSDHDGEFKDIYDEPPEVFGDGGEAAGKKEEGSPALDFLDFMAQQSSARPRFASVEDAVGLMRVVEASDQKDSCGGGGSEILVRYSYTGFSGASWVDRAMGRDVSISVGPKLFCARFLLPSSSTTLAADPESLLRLAGAALANLVCPGVDNCCSDRKLIRALWSSLVAAAPVTLPPGATRIEVTVNVGSVTSVLSSADDDVAHHLIKALPAAARKADERWSAVGDPVPVVMDLPAPPVRREEEDGARPAKRRRFEFDSTEKCAICLEVMERDLAAWPRCEHDFHGECLEQLLHTGDRRCPLCRSELRVVRPYDA